MDEGFHLYISDLAENELSDKKAKSFAGNYRGYYSLVNSVKNSRKHMVIVMTKTTIPISSYTKGSLFLSQLNYVIGADKLAETVKGTTTISVQTPEY
jgi:hypothetical protein